MSFRTMQISIEIAVPETIHAPFVANSYSTRRSFRATGRGKTENEAVAELLKKLAEQTAQECV